MKEDKHATREAKYAPSSRHLKKRDAQVSDSFGEGVSDSEVRRLARDIMQRSPIYELARQVLEGKLPYAEDIAPLLSVVSAPSDIRWKERVVAAWVLGRVELGPGQEAENARIVRVLCEVLENQKHRGIRFIKRCCQYPLRALPLTLPVAILGTLGEVQRGGSGFSWWVTLAFGICWGIGSTCAATLLFSPLLFPLSLAEDTDHANRVRAECARVLGHLRQVESIPVLVATTCDSSKRVQKAAGQALCCILPALETSHYELFNTAVTPPLCRLLKHSSGQFVVHVLGALGKVGNGSAIPHVRRLAEHSQSLRVQEAAQRILPSLQQRQQQEQAPVTLLRPAAGATEAQPAILLRPANKH